MDLDSMLAEAAPDAPEPTVEIARLLDEMAAVRPRGLRGLALIKGGLALGGAVAVAGATAAAVITYTNGSVPDSLVDASYPWTTAQGVTCRVSVSFGPRPATDPLYSAEQTAALAAARAWARSFEITSIDRGEAETHWLDHMEAVSVGHPSRAELVAHFRDRGLETNAVVYAVDSRADRALREHGFDPASLNGGSGIECGGR